MRVSNRTAAACTSVGVLVALAAAPTLAKDKRPMISSGDRAAAAWAIQNVVSRHDYLHALERNMDEVKTDWVSPTGPFASTATFCLVEGCEHGMDVITKAYGGGDTPNRMAEMSLQRLSQVDPNVQNTPENYGAGESYIAHTNSTPIIEIAGDGKTAKGVWYTPGLEITPVVQDGKVHVRGVVSWQKLGVDFVNENGAWKIWHMLVAMDISTPMTQDELAPALEKMGDVASHEPPKPMRFGGGGGAPGAAPGGGPGGPGAGPGGAGGPGGPGGPGAGPGGPGAAPPGGPGGGPPGGGFMAAFQKPQYLYPHYSPERSNKVWPQLPEPYYAFSETFSYCNCEQQLPSVLSASAK